MDFRVSGERPTQVFSADAAKDMHACLIHGSKSSLKSAHMLIAQCSVIELRVFPELEPDIMPTRRASSPAVLLVHSPRRSPITSINRASGRIRVQLRRGLTATSLIPLVDSSRSG